MKWFAFFFLALVMSCSNDEVRIPNDILSEKQMISILIDVHLSDALAASEKLKEVRTLNQVKKLYFLSVLEKHQIDEESFEKSLTFYKAHPAVFYDLYEEVLIELTKRDAELSGENQLKETISEVEPLEASPAEIIKKDSIKKPKEETKGENPKNHLKNRDKNIKNNEQ